MVLGIELLKFSNHACFAHHDSVVVDVSIVGHLLCGSIKVKDLAVYVVDPCSFNLYCTGTGMVLDAAFLVLNFPVGYAKRI